MKNSLQHTAPTIFDAIGNLFIPKRKAEETALPWDNYAWGIDLWGGVGSALTIPEKTALLQSWVDKGCSFLIAKCSDGHQMTKGDAFDVSTYVDPGFAGWCQAAYDVIYNGKKGLPFFAYHVFRGDVAQEPLDNPEADFQFKTIKYAMGAKAGKSVHGVFLDFELADNTNSNLSKMLHRLYIWLTNYKAYDPMWRGIYTSMGVLTSISPDSAVWIGSQTSPVEPLWMAQWVYNAGQSMTWDTLKQYFPSSTAKCKTPGWANWRFWQILGDVAGLYTNALDINLFNGAQAALNKFAADGGWVQRDLPNTDTTPPVLTLTQTPSNSKTATFAWTVNEAAITYAKLDAADYTVTTTPMTYTVTDGQHSWQAYAVDTAGNKGEVVTYSWIVDTENPEPEPTVDLTALLAKLDAIQATLNRIFK